MLTGTTGHRYLMQYAMINCRRGLQKCFTISGRNCGGEHFQDYSNGDMQGLCVNLNAGLCWNCSKPIGNSTNAGKNGSLARTLDLKA